MMPSRLLVTWRRGLGPFEVYDLATGELLHAFVSDRKHINGVWDVTTGRWRYWLEDPDRPQPRASRPPGVPTSWLGRR